MEDIRTIRCISIEGPYRPWPRVFSPSGRRLNSIKPMYINISSNWGFEYIYYCVLLNLLVIYSANLLLVGLLRCCWHLFFPFNFAFLFTGDNIKEPLRCICFFNTCLHSTMFVGLFQWLGAGSDLPVYKKICIAQQSRPCGMCLKK